MNAQIRRLENVAGALFRRRIARPWELILIAAFATTAIAGTHPSLLVTPAELPHIRRLAGVADGGTASNAAAEGKFGGLAADYQALRAHLALPIGDQPLPGELLAAAFMHMVDPADVGDATRIRRLTLWIDSPDPLTTDSVSVAIALDWCWMDVPASVRREAILRIRDEPAALGAADSPLRHSIFREKLAHLAFAIAFDEKDEPSPAWADVRRNLLDAGRAYFRETFPQYCALRGAAPICSAFAPLEESDAALAIELAGHLDGIGETTRPADGESRWNSTGVARWLEHYPLAALGQPAVRHDFLSGPGDAAPLTPCPKWDDLMPLTAHLIASRSGDAAAAWTADAVAADLRKEDLVTAPWRFVPLLLDYRGAARLTIDEDTKTPRMPLARNLGSAIVFRSGGGATAAAVRIETPPVHLRSRQPFAAGNFQVYAGGYLVVSGAESIALEALPAKGGKQRIGIDEPFDFDQYAVATIAHNCLVLSEGTRSPMWRGQRFRPTGGQRLIEGDCEDFSTGADSHPRRICRQLAYGQNEAAAYAALDLAPAYGNAAVNEYSREFVFVLGRVLLIIDRVALTDEKATPTWVLNLPARPTVNEVELQAEARVGGPTNDGGIWRIADVSAIAWGEQDGRATLYPVFPPATRARVVGGSAATLAIQDGDFQGKKYLGGEPNSFERLVLPAGRPQALNAWYRLGTPTVLGADFGTTPHWGRVEVDPPRRAARYLFVNAIALTPSADAGAVQVRSAGGGDGYIGVRISTTGGINGRNEEATVRIREGIRGGGVRCGTDREEWIFPTRIESDASLGAK